MKDHHRPQLGQRASGGKPATMGCFFLRPGHHRRRPVFCRRAAAVADDQVRIPHDRGRPAQGKLLAQDPLMHNRSRLETEFRIGNVDQIERLLCAAAGGTRDADAPASARPRLGGISFLHRFGSALNHHVHLHACVTDGVFVPAADQAGSDAAPAFLPVRLITAADLAAFTHRRWRRFSAGRVRIHGPRPGRGRRRSSLRGGR